MWCCCGWKAKARQTRADEDLVRRVAEKLKLNEREQPESGGEVDLGGGIRVPVGAGMFAGPGESDPLRISRRLIENDPQHWIGVDLVPCVVFSPRGKRSEFVGHAALARSAISSRADSEDRRADVDVCPRWPRAPISRAGGA